MNKKIFLVLVIGLGLFLSCQKNSIEQAGGPIPVKASSYMTFTAYSSFGSKASEIYQVGTNDSNLLAITNSSQIASRYNHNSTFTGYNTLVFSSDSLNNSVIVTALYQYNESTQTLSKLTSGLYRDQNPSYSNYNNIMAFTRDTAWTDTLSPTHPFKNANVLYLNYFNKNTTVAITHFRYGKIGHSTFSKDGSIIYFDYADSTNISHIYYVKLNGTGLTKITNTPYGEEYPSVSPDGSTLAISVFTDAGHTAEEINLINTDGSSLRQITRISPSAIAGQPCWDPSGKMIYFTLYDPGKPSTPSHIYSVNPDGSNLKAFTNGKGEAYPQSTYVSFP